MSLHLGVHQWWSPRNLIVMCEYVLILSAESKYSSGSAPPPFVDFPSGKLAEAKSFSEIDCNSAFWQRKLSEDSRLLTTFITPFGRFCFNRLPYGISTGTEQFQEVMTDPLGDTDG